MSSPLRGSCCLIVCPRFVGHSVDHSWRRSGVCSTSLALINPFLEMSLELFFENRHLSIIIDSFLSTSMNLFSGSLLGSEIVFDFVCPCFFFLGTGSIGGPSFTRLCEFLKDFFFYFFHSFGDRFFDSTYSILGQKWCAVMISRL